MYSTTNNYQPTTFDLTSAAAVSHHHLSPSDIEFDRCLNTHNYQQHRHDSIDYSRRPSYFTGLLGGNNTNSEASYSDHEQQTPSPFNSYEDYNQQHQQYHHPLDNSPKRRLSTLVELPQLYHQQQQQAVYPTTPVPWMNNNNNRCTNSPMMYANPAVDMYSPQTYLNHPVSAPHHQQQQYGGYHPLVVDNLVPSSSNNNDGLFRERASSSSSSSSSDSSLSVSPPPSRRASKVNLKSPLKPTRSRGRRVSNSPSIAGQKVFTCKHDDCGKVFKRSEHLKRHVRSIHTLEKPFECPYQSCSKRFSRSDNLNQHIRIHRHTGKDKNNNNNSTTTTATTTSVNSNTSSRNNSFSNYMPTY